jgi:5'(3')-deoxyribonucleotidase
MDKKILLLDVDEVICFSGFLDLINEFLGTNYTIDDCTNYYVDEQFIPKDRMNEFNKFISTRNLYENAYILPNAIEVIKYLNEYYDIYPLSSCINPFDIQNSGLLFLNKYKFLLNYLPFIDPSKYIFTDSKSRVNGDIIIDDRLSNLRHDIKLKILFPSYHNTDISNEDLTKNNIIRAGYDWRYGWLETKEILMDYYIKNKTYIL